MPDSNNDDRVARAFAAVHDLLFGALAPLPVSAGSI
jgi:hypothetical protein